MMPSLFLSKKATCLCNGVSSPLYTSAMDDEEELLPGAVRAALQQIKERSTVVKTHATDEE